MPSRVDRHGQYVPGRTTLGASEHRLVAWYLAQLDATEQAIRDAWIELIEPPTPSNYKGGQIRTATGDVISLLLTTDRDLPWRPWRIIPGPAALEAGACSLGLMEIDDAMRAVAGRIVQEAYSVWLRREARS